MFDISLRNIFFNEPVKLSMCSRNKNVIKKGMKEDPIVKALNDSSALVSWEANTED